MLKRFPFRIRLLYGLALLALVSGCHGPRMAQESEARRVDVEGFQVRMEEGDAILLDVRTPGEFRTAHIPGAINLDVLSASFAAGLEELDPGRSYLVYCSSGRRSARACRLMEAAGFRELTDLAPGFKGWEAAGLAIER